MPSTIEGRNLRLNAHFHGSSPVTQWYVGLIDADGFEEILSTDSAASHAGWTELESYDEAARPTWAENAASGGAMSGATVTFTLSSRSRIAGCFLASVSTKGSASGVFDSVTQFPTVIERNAGETLKLHVRCRAG